MNVPRLTALLGLAAGVVALRAELVEREQNLWPVVVRNESAALPSPAWTGAGPFLFRAPVTDAAGGVARGFRPFWVQFDRPEGDLRAGYFLYPLFSYAVDETTYHWSVFELVRRWGRREGARPPNSVFELRSESEVFPFWFSREAGDPEESYRALFPIHGTIKNKLGFERLSWTLFPFYVENEKRGAVTTSTPWPFLRVTRGAATGWGFWPFYNHVERPGISRQTTWLWPFGFDNTREPPPDAPPGTAPRRDLGVLPFYVRSTGPGYLNRDFAWPFFGYTRQTQPKRYDENRYFWPFLVQGSGDGVHVNRWAPFYTHSVRKGYDKQWFAWPLLRYAEWSERNIERQRTQLLYFLFWNEEQRSTTNPNARPATLTHLWPLLSHWDNGAGRMQWQAFSPLDVFFPHNAATRLAWSPFFAIARHERHGAGNARTSLLWNAITWERRSADESTEFHLGPLLGVTRRAGERRIALGHGLVGLRRARGEGWRLFWLDFPPTPVTTQSGSR